MKRFLLVGLLALLPTEASAQCNGVFANNTVCGNVTGTANLPRPTNPSAFLGAAGGTNGQVQYNNAGALGGVTIGANLPAVGNATTGIVAGTKTGNTNNFATSTGTLTSGHCIEVDASGNLVDSGASCGGSIYVNPTDYGAVCDGVTNDAVALQAAITAAVGKALFIPTATCLTNTTLNIPSNVTITGGGRDVSIVKSSANPAFLITNASNVTINNIHIQGTNSATSWAVSSQGPISILQNASSVAVGTNFVFRNLKVTDWNVTYWIYVHTFGSTFALRNLTISDNYFISDANSVPNDADPLNDSNYLMAFFTNTAGNGRIENLTINNNFIEATGLCFGPAIFGNVYKYQITNNTIQNPGTTDPTHCLNGLGFTNAYGMLVYDSNVDGNPAVNGLISGNYIVDPKAIGIYFAGDQASFTFAGNASRTSITNNLITGQSTVDGGVLRGAIVINVNTAISIIGNTMIDNTGCVVLVGQNINDVSVLSNHCQSGVGSSLGIRLTSGLNGSSNTDKRIIRGNLIDVQGTAILLESITTQRFHDIDLSGNRIVSAAAAISAASQFFSGTFLTANNSTTGTVAYSGITGSFAISGNAGMSFTAATLPAANNGSSVFVSDGAPASACTGGSTGSTGFRQNSAWKCF